MRAKQEILFLLLLASVPVWIGFFLSNFLTNPPVWPDEAVYADIARNILKEGRLGTDLWSGVLPGVENHAYWYPPLFFYLVSLWSKLFGPSIIAQRLFSATAGSFLVIVFYLFSKIFFKKAVWFSLFTSLLIAFDFTFLRAARVSRPEIFVLLFGTLSLYLFLLFLTGKFSQKQKGLLVLASAFLSSLAFLTHLLGVFFFLIILTYLAIKEKLGIFRSPYFYLFLVAFAVLPLVWILSILPNLSLLIEQLSLAAARKNMDKTWILELFGQPAGIKLLYLFYIFATSAFVFFSAFVRKQEILLLSLILSFSWVFAVVGKQFWYFVYPLPFVYLAAFLLGKTLFRKAASFVLVGAAAVLLLNLRLVSYDQKSYEDFAASILNAVPEGKIVFLSSIPDPYFGFKKEGRDNKLYEFPVVPTSKESYLAVLGESEYVVYNGSYESVLFGGFLAGYLEKNNETIYQVGKPGGYQALVIKLKPATQRLD